MTSSMHGKYQSEQVILFDALSLCSDIDITCKHTCTPNQLLDSIQNKSTERLYDDCSTSKKKKC